MWTSLGTNSNQCIVDLDGEGTRHAFSGLSEDPCWKPRCFSTQTERTEHKEGGRHKLGCLEPCTLHVMEVPSSAEQLPGFLYLNFGSTNHIKKLQKLLLLQLKLPKASHHGCLVGGEKTHTAVVKFTIWKRSLSLQKTGSRPSALTSEEVLAEEGG